MPNRIIKESICSSADIDQLTPFEETVFVRLIVNVDDFGRLDARVSYLKSKLFVTKPGITEKSVSDAVNKLASVGLVKLYTVDNKPFLSLPKWGLHQQVRAKKSKFPGEDESNGNHMISDDSKCPRNPIQSNPIRIQSNPLPDLPSGGEGEKEQKGNEAVDIDEAFEKSYRHYPRKVGKAKGKQLYIAYLKGRSVKGQGKVRLTHHQMTLAIKAYAAEVGEREPDKIKHFDSFMGSAVIDYAERTADDYEAAMKELYGDEWRCISFEYG